MIALEIITRILKYLLFLFVLFLRNTFYCKYVRRDPCIFFSLRIFRKFTKKVPSCAHVFYNVLKNSRHFRDFAKFRHFINHFPSLPIFSSLTKATTVNCIYFIISHFNPYFILPNSFNIIDLMSRSIILDILKRTQINGIR